jgi:hypothetical protein
MKKLFLAAMLVMSMFALGCDKKADDTGSAKPAAAGGGGDSIGVQECDDYLKKMSDCLGKMPAEAKSASEQALKSSKDAWKQAAATPQGKDSLKIACKAALDALANNPMCK